MKKEKSLRRSARGSRGICRFSVCCSTEYNKKHYERVVPSTPLLLCRIFSLRWIFSKWWGMSFILGTLHSTGRLPSWDLLYFLLMKLRLAYLAIVSPFLEPQRLYRRSSGLSERNNFSDAVSILPFYFPAGLSKSVGLASWSVSNLQPVFFLHSKSVFYNVFRQSLSTGVAVIDKEQYITRKKNGWF